VVVLGRLDLHADRFRVVVGLGGLGDGGEGETCHRGGEESRGPGPGQRRPVAGRWRAVLGPETGEEPHAEGDGDDLHAGGDGVGEEDGFGVADLGADGEARRP
jgi:hypothetical protein